jgi:urocanate hydratase
MGGMSGAQPLAGVLNEAVVLDVEARPDRIRRKMDQGYCDRMTADVGEAVRWVESAKKEGKPLSVGLAGNAGEVHPQLVRLGCIPDLLTDQTSSHSLLDYVPIGALDELDALRDRQPEEYKKRALDTVARHVRAILDMQKMGAVAFDYGNNLRAQAEAAGVDIRDGDGHFRYPGFVTAYIRPLFCEGRGPFRWAALSGEAADIDRLDRLVLEMFPENRSLVRWIRLAGNRIPQLGLPARVCWLGYGERAAFGLEMNRLVAKGEIRAPVVIGRDHLDCGSVASPNRETEGMLDGSDAVADWPLLNFALNAVNGASWVSFHHGGGVGVGYSLHAGMVIVADGTNARAGRLERVLTVDPGIGIARHADAGYPAALKIAEEKHIQLNNAENV